MEPNRTGTGSPVTGRAPDLSLAAIGDARRIAEAHVRARRSAYEGLIAAPILATESVPERESRWIARLANPNGRCWLLSDEDGLFGFAYTAPTLDLDLTPEIAELYAIYLLAEKTGMGFGRRLIFHALEDLRDRGFREVVLWYAVENRRAARFYMRVGFEVDPRIGPEPFAKTGLTRRRLCRSLSVLHPPFDFGAPADRE